MSSEAVMERSVLSCAGVTVNGSLYPEDDSLRFDVAGDPHTDCDRSAAELLAVLAEVGTRPQLPAVRVVGGPVVRHRSGSVDRHDLRGSVVTSDLASITERLGAHVEAMDAFATWAADALGDTDTLTICAVELSNQAAAILGDLQPLAVDRSEVVDDREPEPEGDWLDD